VEGGKKEWRGIKMEGMHSSTIYQRFPPLNIPAIIVLHFGVQQEGKKKMLGI
jgi:hypothetical protein